jgi:hypothetical protein
MIDLDNFTDDPEEIEKMLEQLHLQAKPWVYSSKDMELVIDPYMFGRPREPRATVGAASVDPVIEMGKKLDFFLDVMEENAPGNPIVDRRFGYAVTFSAFVRKFRRSMAYLERRDEVIELLRDDYCRFFIADLYRGKKIRHEQALTVFEVLDVCTELDLLWCMLDTLERYCGSYVIGKHDHLTVSEALSTVKTHYLERRRRKDENEYNRQYDLWEFFGSHFKWLARMTYYAPDPDGWWGTDEWLETEYVMDILRHIRNEAVWIAVEDDHKHPRLH